MSNVNLSELNEAELERESVAAISEGDENRLLAVETERARRKKGSSAGNSVPILSGDALAVWRRRAANPIKFKGDIAVQSAQLRYMSYRMLDFLYNAPDDRISQADKGMIEEEWQRRERYTYEWPYLTMRERHRLRVAFSVSLSVASLLALLAFFLISKDAKASAFGYQLLGHSLATIVLGFAILGALPLLLARGVCKLRGTLPSTAKPDFRVGKTRAIITALVAVLLGLAAITATPFLEPEKSVQCLLGGLLMFATGTYYLWSGRPAASEKSFIIWGKLHGRSKD